MARHSQIRPIDDAVELPRVNGFDGLAEAVTVLLNSAMRAERSEYLGAAPYERSAHRIGYANGYKDKQFKTRLGTLPLKVPQTRDGQFYPQSLEKGLRSERALLPAIAEMYVEGVSTRWVQRIVEELYALEVSSSQVSRAAAELDAQHEKVRQGGQVLDAAVLIACGVAALPVPPTAKCRALRAQSVDAGARGSGHPGDLQRPGPGRGGPPSGAVWSSPSGTRSRDKRI